MFSNINLSYNNCSYSAAFYCSSSSSNPDNEFSYSSIISNTAAQCRIIFYGDGAKGIISSFNNIDNEQKDQNTHEIIYAKGSIEVKNSCLLGNTAKYLFYENSNSRTFVVTNCTIDVDANSKKNSYVTIASTASSSFQQETAKESIL